MIADAEPTTEPGDGEEAPAPGVVIGSRYVVLGVLGRGGMSVVLRARDLRLGHVVALKVLRASEDRRSQHTQRFLREARVIAQLRSDHVVNVLDVDTESDPPYLAMELLEGHTVAELLEARGRLPVDVALRIVVQACRGVADAHALGVMHRDLKPSNLIVTRAADGRQRVKVIDFGISKPFLPNATEPALTSTGQILGSPRYMSPEQVRAGAAIDARADIWALGAILYELIAGVSPFEAPTVADTLARIVRDRPAPLRDHAPDVPARVASVIFLCLSKDPLLRPPDVRALLEELEAVTPSGELTVESPREGERPAGSGETTQGTGARSWSLARPSPPARSPRRALVAAVVASAGIAALLGGWALDRPGAPPGPPSAAAAAAAPPHAVDLLEPLQSSAPAAHPAASPSPPPAVGPRGETRGRTEARPHRADAATSDEDLELNRRE